MLSKIFFMQQKVGQELAYWRRRMRFTQQELALKLGVPRTTLANWESPERDISIPYEHIVKLKEMGFGGGTVQESRTPYNPNPDCKLALEVLYDCNASQELRSLAKNELEKALGIN